MQMKPIESQNNVFRTFLLHLQGARLQSSDWLVATACSEQTNTEGFCA